ncbi:hypothetical protein NHX12_026252 [Muraenolepis orangiensis]|uniref:Uncharacterized protein n=1 Tax=Muraenolepis orangiensis TaxID=630683 RepID=A0A9Q0IQJ6_9TELE|nr:hypothetical protein NHX12_026252 [Muraenolepis orangiensis]
MCAPRHLTRNTEASEKRQRPGSRPVDSPAPDDPEKAFSRPLLGEPRSFFHFYISEEEQQPPRKWSVPRGGEPGDRRLPDSRGFGGTGSLATEREAAARGGEEESGEAGLRPIGRAGGGGAATGEPTSDEEEEDMCHFDIPNFVNSESPSSSLLGCDDLLICRSSLPLDGRSQTREAHSTVA